MTREKKKERKKEIWAVRGGRKCAEEEIKEAHTSTHGDRAYRRVAQKTMAVAVAVPLLRTVNRY